MARTAKIAKSLKKPKFKVRIRNAAAAAAARAGISANSRCAESVFAVWR